MMDISLKSLYICVKDMDRAISFYERLLEKDVSEKDEIYSVFNINGFRFGLFAYKKVNEEHIFGSNCLPSFSVCDLNKLKDKIKDKNICFPLTRIKENWVVEIVDSEGNHIELTAPIDSRMNNKTELMKEIELLHTTSLSDDRIRRNLSLEVDDVSGWCRNIILDKKSKSHRKGKNWYIENDDIILTVNAESMTLITAHKKV